MSEPRAPEAIHTAIWAEEAMPDSPLVARAAWCHGYDVFGGLVGRIRWSDMVFLLFRGEAPSPEQSDLLEALAVALANAGPRDPAVHAAMSGGVGGSPSASCLMAALAVGAGASSGAREVMLAQQAWAKCGRDLDAWRALLATTPPADASSAWPSPSHPAGFDPHGGRTCLPVQQTLAVLASIQPEGWLAWLATHRTVLEAAVQLPLSLTGVAAAAYLDLGLTPEQGEMLHLLLRLPGAAVHALEQRARGYKTFPFGNITVEPEEGVA
ncbi:MAG TPA: hypothetical protein VFM34_08675 [Moraxellaceae bacterium]|nr:hypothetical protein [Moraxellaceae bacterium]